MKKYLCLVLVILLTSSCGYSSRSNDLTGQVKFVTNKTPIICDDFSEVSLSLGVVRNGVGSMSTQDMDMEVPAQLVDSIVKAKDNGKLVKVVYDTRRFSWCRPQYVVRKVEILE